jgi:hypothetical protein
VWRWNGRDVGGHALSAGVLMAKVRGTEHATLRLSWMP